MKPIPVFSLHVSGVDLSDDLSLFAPFNVEHMYRVRGTSDGQGCYE